MSKESKIKIILSTTYIIIIVLFLWVFFSYFSLDEITDYTFIKNNTEFLIQFKNNNTILIILIFFLSIILWVLLLGFGSPVCLIGGFLLGKWIGTIVVAFGLSIGATLLYLLSQYFLRDIVIEKFSRRFENLTNKFKKNEFMFFLIYRFVGGIPFFLSNIIPTLFNVRKTIFLIGTFLGMLPQIFIMVSLGSGIEKIIDDNLAPPTIKQILMTKEIYLPITAFIFVMLITVIVKKTFYKN